MTDGPPRLPRANRYTVDDLPEIDIHRLRREGAVRLGATTITLTINGVERPIELSWRPATLGSQVVTAKCPQCNAKRWRLYVVAGGLVGCRGCLQLTYLGRLVRGGFVLSRARRMRKRLGASPLLLGPLPSRAGRRGWVALEYDKLAAEIIRRECEVLSALAALTAELDRRKPPP
jgi:hypothetical protein